jgi:CHAT domain-containing protein
VPAAAEAFVVALQEKERLEFEVSLNTRDLDLVDLVEHNDPASVILGVPADAVLIDYVRFSPGPARGEEHYAAFVVLGGNLMSGDFIDLGDATGIDRLIRDFYDLIQSGSTGDAFSRRFGRSPGEALRAKLIDRVRPLLNGRSHLFLSPDGLLARLPFECLPVGMSGFLIDEFTIGYVSSSRTALYFHKQKPSQGSAPIVMGAPDYGAAVRSLQARFKPLDGAKKESEEVASLLGVEPLTGNAASKEVLHGASPRILHIATHGYFLSDARSRSIFSKAPLLRSGLALSGANSEDGSGILTAEEVLSLNLRDTELVVLSACETGIGEYERGEALAGLARSFEAAGAWSVVTSLWKVPDDATRNLMKVFYRELAAGVRRPEALRRAKLATRDRHREMLAWAGFIIQGYPGSLTNGPELQQGTMQ